MAKEIGNWSKHGRRWIGRTPQEIIASRLRRGERLVWSSRGNGHGANRPAPGIAKLADLIVLLIAGMLLVLVPGSLANLPDPRALAPLIPAAVAVFFVVPRSLFGHSAMVYGLTDQRLIIVNYLMFGLSISYEPSRIVRLLAADYGSRGDVIFRNDESDSITFQAPADPGGAFLGIENPERVAKLIQATLTPNTPVELVTTVTRPPV